MKPLQRVLTAGILLALTGLSCNLNRTIEQEQPAPSTPTQAQAEPSTRTPESSPTPTETEIPAQPTRTQEPTAAPPTTTPTQATVQVGPCEGEVCLVPFQFPFTRPISPPGRDFIDVSYRFGSSDHGKRDPHHGVEFLNSFGTPVFAAADGEVVAAGDDSKMTLGLYPNMYGNLVALQHEAPGFEQPIFTLYAHLSRVDVQVGDRVKAGQNIGQVGSSGAAIGSHLHFEVRYGENTYAASRNPELWLRPLMDDAGQAMGVLAGRILDGQGQPMKVANIVVEALSGGTYYLNTYSESKLVGQDPWQESFAIGDLLAGEYQINFVQGGMQQRTIEVQPGVLTLVTFRIGGQ